jgi:hypothetical protein
LLLDAGKSPESNAEHLFLSRSTVTNYLKRSQGKAGKITRSEKVEVELIFGFRDGKKTAPDFAKATSGIKASEPAGASAQVGVYPLRCIEDFFPSRKLEERLKIRFRSREGFCRPSQAGVSDSPCKY